MKKIILFLSLTIGLFAHNLLLNVHDNGDNTITVAGEFSTGEDASGAMIRLESLVSGDVLFQQRLPKESELTVEIPKEPYQIVLDGGPGHTIIKDGIAPKEGFKEEVKAKNKQITAPKKAMNEWNNITIIFFTICIILFMLAIYFSNKNTNKILQELRKS